MTTAAAHKRGLFDAIILEPVELAISQPHQALISALSVYLVASEAAMLAQAPFNWLMAIGAEWAYLKGLSSGQTVRTKWATALNWSAVLLVVLYGSLWGMRRFGVPLPDDGYQAIGFWPIVGSIALTLVHILCIGAVTICSAMVHAAALGVERVSRDKTAAEEAERLRLKVAADELRARRIEEAEDALRIEMRRKDAELRLMEETARRKMQLAAERAGLRSATKSATTRNRIIVDNIEYPSVQAAADAHGISRQAMSKRLRRNV